MNYYPHHIGDYITATAHLSMIEDGAYRRMLDLYYSREQALPSEQKALYRLLRARSQEEQEAVDIVLGEFFEETMDGWIHGRCDEEIEKARASGERARTNGKKGGRPRKDEPKANLDDDSGKPEYSEEETHRVNSGFSKETHQEPTGNPEQKPPIANSQEPNNVFPDGNTKGAVAPADLPPADPPDAKPRNLGLRDLVAFGINEQHARDWLAVRKRHRAPLTPTAWARVVSESEKAGMTPMQAVEICAARGWRGFESEWLHKSGPPGGQTRADRLDAWSAGMSRVIEAGKGGRPQTIDMGTIDATGNTTR
ncbi:YdaU family protein [Corticimicrobacter populi]|uniref:DUF1376 domain-containing protein n=1 Tax=Corticimicrobacter populi TaxID=2175229 RepID=A0A2V1K1R4_9BURK|nr:YdaU family protein [Corticimicrobacter populi]PWF25041.1 hypothetical protein DD235_02405 [Corticimicrobacter populi]